MGVEEYLRKIIQNQYVPDEEWEFMKGYIEEIEELIDRIGEIRLKPEIVEAGSRKKGTIIRDSYDLDLVLYFPNNMNQELEDIAPILLNEFKEYYDNVIQKKIAITINFPNKKYPNVQNFHIDIVPARLLRGTDKLVWVYQWNKGEVIKSSVQKHIDDVQNFQRKDILKLLKLWRFRNNGSFSGFILERIAIDIIEPIRNYGNKPIKNLILRIFMYLRFEFPSQDFLKDPADRSHNLIDKDNFPIKERLDLIELAKKTLQLNLDDVDDWRKVLTGNIN
jgi:hypothetical protein